MTIVSIIKVIGWIFSITPVLIFLGIGVSMIKGAMEDDELIRALVLIGMGTFFMGVVMLVLIYMTNLFS